MRLVDAIIAFPGVILILALVVVIGPNRTLGPLPAGLPSLFAALFAAGWALYARLARGEVLALRNRDFVTATRLLGYSNTRIVTRHLLPTVIRTTATYAVADAILVIITTASLAFLGAGVQPPTAEWGAIMYEGRSVLATAWWVSTMPGRDRGDHRCRHQPAGRRPDRPGLGAGGADGRAAARRRGRGRGGARPRAPEPDPLRARPRRGHRPGRRDRVGQEHDLPRPDRDDRAHRWPGHARAGGVRRDRPEHARRARLAAPARQADRARPADLAVVARPGDDRPGAARRGGQRA